MTKAADSRKTTAKRRAERRGRRAEWLAAALLICKGYRITSMRYKCRAGEIDIIARKGDLAVFVEVKARNHEQSAVDAVTPFSQHRIRAASDHWLARQREGHTLSCRYDIIACLPRHLPRHFLDAF